MKHYWGLLHRLCATPAALNVGLLVAFMGIALASCGYSSSHLSISPSTQSPAQVTRPPAPVQNCGVVQGPGSLKVPIADSGAEQAENCFWHAFQSCQPATLLYVLGGVDPALIRTFTIHNESGTCSISDAKQQRIVPNPPSAAETYTCAGLMQRPNGLNIYGCGKDGDVLVSDL